MEKGHYKICPKLIEILFFKRTKDLKKEVEQHRDGCLKMLSIAPTSYEMVIHHTHGLHISIYNC